MKNLLYPSLLIFAGLISLIGCDVGNSGEGSGGAVVTTSDHVVDVSESSPREVVEPPAQGGTQSVQSNPLILTVNAKGEVVMEGGEALEGESIEAQLKNLYRAKPDSSVLLRGEQDASHGRVIELLDTVKKIGFKRVELVIVSPKKAP